MIDTTCHNTLWHLLNRSRKEGHYTLKQTCKGCGEENYIKIGKHDIRQIAKITGDEVKIRDDMGWDK